MSYLFEGVSSQFIDNEGKTRILNYEIGSEILTLYTSPLPPLPTIQLLTEINSASPDTLKEFLIKADMSVTSQYVVDGVCLGVWCIDNKTPKRLTYAYIPINYEGVLESIPIETDEYKLPIDIISSSSLLKEFEKNQRIANYLIQYTLLLASSIYPSTLTPNNFVVDEEHEYNINSLNKLLIYDNDVFYRTSLLNSQPRIIVPTADAIERLIYYVAAFKLTNETQLIEYKNRKNISGVYNTLSDFRISDSQFIFTNAQSLYRWTDSPSLFDQNLVEYKVNLTIKEPYYYRNINVDGGKLFLVQNVFEGSILRALRVSEEWRDRRVNIGYNAKFIDNADSTPYTVYTINGPSPSSNNPNKVLLYYGNIYAALLEV